MLSTLPSCTLLSQYIRKNKNSDRVARRWLRDVAARLDVYPPRVVCGEVFGGCTSWVYEIHSNNPLSQVTPYYIPPLHHLHFPTTPPSPPPTPQSTPTPPGTSDQSSNSGWCSSQFTQDSGIHFYAYKPHYKKLCHFWPAKSKLDLCNIQLSEAKSASHWYGRETGRVSLNPVGVACRSLHGSQWPAQLQPKFNALITTH